MQAGRCVHFNGVQHEQCAAGVAYKDLAGGEPGWGKLLPCLARLAGPNPRLCDKRREPTAEEIAAYRKELEERCDRIGKIREAIVTACGGPWKKGASGSKGTIQCPCCEGVVRFTRSGYNGHIHAGCSTAGCAQWME